MASYYKLLIQMMTMLVSSRHLLSVEYRTEYKISCRVRCPRSGSSHVDNSD